MKRLFKKRWARYVAVIILVASCGAIFTPQKSSAVIDAINLTEPANYLKNMGETCYNLKKTGGNLDSSPWAACELQQKLLKERLGCDAHMFYSVDQHPDKQDLSFVDTRWYVIPERYAACVELAQAKLDYIKADSPCKSMLHISRPGEDQNSPGWVNCSNAQDALHITLNCSDHMFKERADSEDHWTQVPAALTACDAEIVDARQTKLTDSDGNKAIATESAPPPADAGGITDSSSSSGSGTSCAGGGMGWLFCPMINYMTKTIQIAAGLVDKLMTVKFLSSESGGKSIEGIWRVVLTVANILLVIAFMFIIFSQSTSAGLSNYGIKRMLPRLVIAAILMNLSFYICAIAIDLSNIIGGSIMGFLLGSGNSIGSSVTAATSGPGGVGSFLGGAVAGVAIIGLLFFLLTPIVLGMLAFFVAIIGRQVILLVLVLVSPLAFVAWLLPNTEKLFKKWSSLFFELLIMYPAVMLIFGASLLLSNLIGGNAGGINLAGG